MIRCNFFLTDDLVKRLKEVSEKSGVPMSEIVRRAIYEYLKQHAAAE